VLYAAAAIAVLLLGAKYARGPSSSEPSAPAPPPASAVRVRSSEGGGATVHVAGAVRRPGVYRMRAGSRIDDAVRRAGGATSKADLSAVNLAAKVEDGRQVLVPERAPSVAAVGGAGGAGGAAPPAGTSPPGRPLDLNTATLEQLDTLAGVGPATAQKIVDFREEHGGFGSVDELARVPGIGDKRLASLREQVRV
jgi:competence protein ComEA